jgi:tetratricopeptide (TPR) repeat protein
MTENSPDSGTEKVVLDSSDLEQSLESADQAVVELLAQARALRREGDLKGAAEKFQQAIGRDKVCLPAYIGLAGIYTLQDKPDVAFELLAQATTRAKKVKDVQGDQAEIFFFLGEMELQLNNLAEAMGFMEQADEGAPQDGKMQVRIADALLEANHLQESAEFYQKALELDPELAHAFNRLGIVYRRQGNHELAQSLYRKALVFHPDDEHLLYNLALSLFESGQRQPALEQLAIAIKINPDFSEAVQLKSAIETAE